MNKQKLYGAVGLARRAGKCIAGDFAVERAVKGKKAAYVLLDCSASEATKERYHGLCERQGIGCIELESVGSAIGKPGNKIIAIIDENFAKMLKTAINESEKGAN